jgi:hypothetical protein
MLRRLNGLWKKLTSIEPGQRFQTFHREQRDRSPAVKAAFLGLAIALFAAGVVFAFIPGPAVLFFAVSGALLATQSLWVARGLDASELWGRRALSSIRSRWQRRRTRAGAARR